LAKKSKFTVTSKPLASANLHSPSKRPVVYRVPDDSDVEDASSDESGGIEHSLEIIRESCRPMSTQPPIDLTEDDFTVNLVEANLNAQEVPEHLEDASPQTHASPRSNIMSEDPCYPPMTDEDVEALEADFAAESQSDAENEAPYDPAAAMDGYQELIIQHGKSGPPVSIAFALNMLIKCTEIDRTMAEVCRAPLVWANESTQDPSRDLKQSEEVTTVPPTKLLLNISSTGKTRRDMYKQEFQALMDCIERQPPLGSQNPPSLREVDGTVPENIGEKYGKEDFFAAMKQNRETVVPQQPANLEESGRKFLQTPPEDLAEPEISRGPVLDDSSAYQYELSKKAITKQSSMKRTRMDIKDLVEPSSIEHGAVAKTARSAKRKADDISQTTAEEESFANSTSPTHARTETDTTHLPTNQSLSCAQSPRAALQAKISTDLRRPHKKIRRAAEVFGYAALGGLAVMSALIATAPAL
jgi:hypothetical protein